VGEARREARREVWVRENGMFGVGEGEGSYSQCFGLRFMEMEGEGCERNEEGLRRW